MRLVAGALVALWFLSPWTAPMALATCDSSTDPDKSDIASARAAVTTNCPCGAEAHGAYVRCAAEQANMALTNKACARFVKKCAARSTCGKSGSVSCCRTDSKGVTRCSIKGGPEKCVAPIGGAACVGQFASCCEACRAGGCAPTTTTTTSTTTLPPATTTSTTLPLPPPCQGFCECADPNASCFDNSHCAEGDFCCPFGVGGGRCFNRSVCFRDTDCPPSHPACLPEPCA